MTFLPQSIRYAGLKGALYIDHPGEQLIMHARMLDRLADVHPPVDIQDGLDDRTEYSRAARSANDEERCTIIVSDDCR